MIPKIIHYCWFGKSEMPEKIERCIASWKKNLPEYELKLWNEDNFDVHSNTFTEEAYLHGKYAFVSDYVRFYAINKYGGIYFDTDMEVIKSFNPLLEQDFFCCLEGENVVATCVVAAKPQHILCREMLAYYQDRPFCKNGKLDMKPNTVIFTQIISELYHSVTVGSHEGTDSIHIYSRDFFHPLNTITNELRVTENSYAIHWHTALWVNQVSYKLKWFLRMRVILPLVGESGYKRLRKHGHKREKR